MTTERGKPTHELFFYSGAIYLILPERWWQKRKRKATSYFLNIARGVTAAAKTETHLALILIRVLSSVSGQAVAIKVISWSFAATITFRLIWAQQRCTVNCRKNR